MKIVVGKYELTTTGDYTNEQELTALFIGNFPSAIKADVQRAVKAEIKRVRTLKEARAYGTDKPENIVSEDSPSQDSHSEVNQSRANKKRPSKNK